MRRTLALIALLVAGCSREPPMDPAVARLVGEFDQQQAKMAETLRLLREKNSTGERDFRARTYQDDFDQWVLSRQTRDEIASLRAQAIKTQYIADTQQYLQRAASDLDTEARRAKEITAYWKSHPPAPYWRRYWESLFKANEQPAEEPDSMLIGIESRMKKSLDAGDFASAAGSADELNGVFDESLNRAAQRIFHERKQASLDFKARKTACVKASKAAPWMAPAKIIRGDAIDSFYPRQAIQRGESGAVVLRARIDPSGCAQQVAIVVHSGVASIDDAALAWFETATFSPAAERGIPIESELVWKVRFIIKQDP